MKDYKNYLTLLNDLKTGKISNNKINSFPFFNKCNFKLNSLVIIGGRTGVGKSTFALNLLRQIITHNSNINVIYFSLEMDKIEVFHKLTALTARIPLNKIECGQVDDLNELNRKMGIYKDRLTIMDKLFQIEDIINYIQELKEKDQNLKVVFIDYLGLAINYDNNRYLNFGKFTRILHQMAKKLNLCIVSLNQLNRYADHEEEPELIHLRDSGTLEQDAEQVFLIFEDKENFYVKIAKNRYGISNLLHKFKFEKDFATIDDF